MGCASQILVTFCLDFINNIKLHVIHTYVGCTFYYSNIDSDTLSKIVLRVNKV